MDYLKSDLDLLPGLINEKILAIDNSLKRRKLFLDTVKYCVNEKFERERLEVVLSSFSSDGDIDDVLILICREFSFPKKYSSYIFSHINSFSEMKEILKRSFIYTTIPFPVLLTNLKNLYDRQLSDDDIEYLLIELESIDTPQKETIKNCLLTSKSSYAEVPDWVNVQEGEDHSLIGELDYGDSYTKYEDKMKEMIDEANEKMIINGENIKKEEKESHFDEREEVNLVDQVIKSYLRTLRSDSTGKRDRVYGPENRILDRDCGVTIGVDGVGGPCRMFVCLCGEDEEDEGWFTGRCQVCHSRIRDLSHAVRFPLRSGGWLGCYCSFDCIYEGPPERIVRDDEIRMHNILQVLKDVGVMNRGV